MLEADGGDISIEKACDVVGNGEETFALGSSFEREALYWIDGMQRSKCQGIRQSEQEGKCHGRF